MSSPPTVGGQPIRGEQVELEHSCGTSCGWGELGCSEVLRWFGESGKGAFVADANGEITSWKTVRTFLEVGT